MSNLRHPISKKIKDKVKARFDGRCGYCGEESEKLCIDHIHPIMLGHMYKGKTLNDLENLMPACFSCNNYKHNWLLEEFRQNLASQISKARQYSLNFRLAERYGLLEVKEKTIQFYFEKVTQ